jgi:TolB-like protein/class 3 adenylate cyclase/lipoprotein NlpI
MERRLAAVLIADVVGYGRLSQADEEGTRARFQADLRELFAPRLAAHHGRLVKTMGDGLLVEFRSVVDAVRCAIELQQDKARQNIGAPPDRRLVYRIGINLGDIIVEGEDIHGDGVNIAERLQALAEPGGIAIAGVVHDQVRHRVEAAYASLGEQQIKNVAEPVAVYRIVLDPVAASSAGAIAPPPWRLRRRLAGVAGAVVVLLVAAGAAAWWRPWEPQIEPAQVEDMALPLPDVPSIAVLPFANMSGDPQQDYFADGITDDLITELSKVSGLFVISRNSTFVYKGKAAPPKEVSEALGVRYVLEGSVQRAGDTLRINAQLIDALSGGHAWADRFDGSLGDVFALQDKVTRSVADALALRLTAAEQAAPVRQETSVPAAYDAFLRGWEHYRRTTAKDFAAAIPAFEEAIRLDPDYGRAYAALALVYFQAGDLAWTGELKMSWRTARDKAGEYLALARKRPTSTYHQAAGNIARERGWYDSALAEFKQASVLDPSDSWSYAYMAHTLVLAGRPAEAIAHLETAMRLDPHYPPVFTYYRGLAELALDRYAEAAASLEATLQRNPDDEWPALFLAAAYAELGRDADAVAAVDRFNAIRVERGGVPASVFELSELYWMSKTLPLDLALPSLRRVDVPVSCHELYGKDPWVERKLTGDELRALLLGRSAHGRSIEGGEEHAWSIAADGSATMSGDWGDGTGVVRIRDDEACFEWPGGMVNCGAVYRNPGGTKAKENEYFWYNTATAWTCTFPFSIVE